MKQKIIDEIKEIPKFVPLRKNKKCRRKECRREKKPKNKKRE